MASVVVPVLALLIFFAVLAALVVHSLITRHQDRQSVLVNGVSAGLSRTVCRLNGLGSRGLDPTLTGDASWRG
jgi:hypothetical protein